MKKFFVLGILGICLCGMAFLFWNQEMQYLLPTPIPDNYINVSVKEPIDLGKIEGVSQNQANYLHFFNPDCPCSRFNLKHFKSLVNQFDKIVAIYAVIPAYADLNSAIRMIDDERVKVILDKNDLLAKACGVYATPQAVIIDTNQQLYFRGNYNRSRYCTLKETNYAEIALTAFANGETPPVFNTLALQAYGCELPTDQ